MVERTNRKEDDMCYSSEGKYIIDGKEINIDFDDIESIPIELLKKLENSNMNQLDAFYIRKRMHKLTNTISNLSISLGMMESSIPEMASKEVHKIVNGKFDKISKALENIENKQKVNSDNECSRIAAHENLLNKIESNIQYMTNKTIFGWMKNRFEKKPLSTVLLSALAGVLTVMLIMRVFHIETFTDIFEMIEKWKFW